MLCNPNVPGFAWFDNPLGYRLASTVQADMKFKGLVKEFENQARYPVLTWNTFLLATVWAEETPWYELRTGDDSEADTLYLHSRAAACGDCIAGTDFYQQFAVYADNGTLIDQVPL